MWTPHFQNALLAITFVISSPALRAANFPTPQEANYTIRDFHFKDGETLPELRLHYATLGAPAHGAYAGRHLEILP